MNLNLIGSYSGLKVNQTKRTNMKGKALVGIGVAVLLIFIGININNGLVEKEEIVESAWAQVENQYQRRADLVPNLVPTVVPTVVQKS